MVLRRFATPFDSLDKWRNKAIGVTGGEVKKCRPWHTMCLFLVSDLLQDKRDIDTETVLLFKGWRTKNGKLRSDIVD